MTCNWQLLAFLWALIALAIFWWRNNPPDSAAFATTRIVAGFSRRGIRAVLAGLTPWFFWMALVFLSFALSDPIVHRKIDRTGESKPPPIRMGIGLYYLLDQSGSMKETVDVTSEKGVQKIEKINLAKDAIWRDVHERKGDLVGLISFARAARVVCPLTQDLQEFIGRLKEVEPVSQESLNGTAIGYAIFKAVNIFVATDYFAKRLKEQKDPAYAIEQRALVVITDGLQSPHPEDRQNPFRFIPIDTAIRYAKENNVRVYFIGIDPVFRREEFTQAVNEISQATSSTGGKFFVTSQLYKIDEVLSEINTLEKGKLSKQYVSKNETRAVSLLAPCILIALVFFGSAMLLETTYCRRLP